MIDILGIGTLLCPASVARTCPDFQNFRLITLQGYKRVFNKVDPTLPTFTSTAIANISLVPCEAAVPMVVSVFSIPEDQFHHLLVREFDYDMATIIVDDNGTPLRVMACLKSSDAAINRLASSHPLRAKALADLRTRYQGDIWRSDIYPAPSYIAKCRKAANNQSAAVWENFLDTTFLADEKTSLRRYLAAAKNL